MVTYYPDAALNIRLRRIAEQVALLVIVDNTPQTIADISTLPERIANLILISNARNVGLAAGLNIGAGYAVKRGYEWLLTLDQDTVVNPNLIDGLHEVYASYPQKPVLGILAANATIPPTERLMEEDDGGNNPYMERKTVITSGSLVSASALQRVGPFKEELFIEGIDLEFCLRLRRSGFRIVCSRKPLMVHGAGAMKEARFFSRRVPVTHHAPWRYKYMARNLVLISREYYRSEPRWICQAFVNLFKMTLKICLYERERGKKLGAIIQGLFDGFTGKRYTYPGT